MQAAPAPIGLIFTGLGCLQRGLGILDLVLRTGFLGEFHIGPDRAQQLFDGPGVDDGAVVAVNDAARGHVDCHILDAQEGTTLGGAAIDAVDTQVSGDLTDMGRGHGLNRKVIFRAHASRVDFEDIAGRPHRATRRDQRDIRTNDGGGKRRIGGKDIILRR